MSTAVKRRGLPFLPSRRSQAGDGSDGSISGTARLDRRTKKLVKRLGPNDIAFIDHTNIDRMAAEDLVKTGVKAVVNASQSSNGRYPNAGPLILARAGVCLIDAPDAGLFERFDDGEPVSIDGGEVRSASGERVSGLRLEVGALECQLAEQRREIDEALAAFAENTVSHVQREGRLLTDGLELPELKTDFRDRHALIVVRGPSYRRDLQALDAYIRDVRPILVGVDGGADALFELGFSPDLILGDMDSAGDQTLRCGAELIVHAYSDGRAPGSDRLDELGLPYHMIPAPGTSQDVAMLMAFEKGAGLIVSVGAHFNLVEFLDKNREGMSSTFLTRLKIGEVLVDAKGVSRLYRPGLGLGRLSLFMLAFLLLVVIVIATSSGLADLAELIWLRLRVMFNLM